MFAGLDAISEIRKTRMIVRIVGVVGKCFSIYKAAAQIIAVVYHLFVDSNERSQAQEWLLARQRRLFTNLSGSHFARPLLSQMAYLMHTSYKYQKRFISHLQRSNQL